MEGIKGRNIVAVGTPQRRKPKGRVCKQDDCGTILSIYNLDTYCRLHSPIVLARSRGRKYNGRQETTPSSNGSDQGSDDRAPRPGQKEWIKL